MRISAHSTSIPLYAAEAHAAGCHPLPASEITGAAGAEQWGRRGFARPLRVIGRISRTKDKSRGCVYTLKQSFLTTIGVSDVFCTLFVCRVTKEFTLIAKISTAASRPRISQSERRQAAERKLLDATVAIL